MGFTFNEVFKQALDVNLSFPVRWSCAKRAVWKYACLTGQHFSEPFERIGNAAQISLLIIHTFPVHTSITEKQLYRVLSIVSEERERYLTKYNLYQVEREKEKQAGRLRSGEIYRIFLARPDHYDRLCTKLAPYRPFHSQKYGYLNEKGELGKRLV